MARVFDGSAQSDPLDCIMDSEWHVQKLKPESRGGCSLADVLRIDCYLMKCVPAAAYVGNYV